MEKDKMKIALPYVFNGWVSLPIIALLLAMSSLSVLFKDSVLASYQWRGQLNEIENSQQVWIDFHQAVVATPNFTSATTSECVGFCELSRFTEQHRWQKENALLHYRWERYEPQNEEGEQINVSYRLCATQNQQQYRCWWWREDRLLSNGWVSASD